MPREPYSTPCSVSAHIILFGREVASSWITSAWHPTRLTGTLVGWLLCSVAVVAFVFGEFGNPVEEIHRCHEVLDRPLAANPFAVFRQFPAGQILQQSLGLFARDRWDATLTRLALFRLQFFDCADTHGYPPVNNV